jgi:uncharacterized protein YbaP (TraB family)
MNQSHSTIVSKRKKHMIRLIMTLYFFISGILMAINSNAQQNMNTAGNFYAITGKGLKDTSWIFGTYHLVKSSYLDEVPAVLKAFNKSAGVVVEVVIDSAKLPMAAEMGMLKDKTLADLLDKPFTDSLDNEIQSTLGVGVAQINQLKPINVALTLSMVYIITDKNSPLNKYTGSMIDGYFAATGKQKGKQVTSLETIEEQMDVLFNKTSNEEQANQLKQFLRNKPEMIKQGNGLVESWFRHDLDKMYAIAREGLDMFGNSDDLLRNRNEKWMEVLPGLMAKQSQFIAVGTLHLPGPDGILEKLTQLGYTITPVKL